MNTHHANPPARALALLALLLCGVRAAAAQTPEPVSGVIAVDTSASVESLSGADGRRFLEAFARFAQEGGGRDEFAVVKISTYASVSLGRTGDSAGVAKRLSELFSEKEPQATSLFDGCALALKTASGGRNARRFILVLSDGLDTVSELSLKEVQKLLKESGVKLFAVEVGRRSSVGGSDDGFRNLEALAKASGGAAYRLKKKTDFDAIMASVAAAVRR
jgi:hypothetical protein